MIDPADAMTSSDDAFNELCCYTLSRGDSSFIHQHVVDAYAAQTADANTKPIKLTFALVGLYLHIEKGFSGKEVQRAHMYLARKRRAWPVFSLPQERGSLGASQLVLISPGDTRDAMIHEWCTSVWNAFRASHQGVAELTRRLYLDLLSA
jgi:hypothetical protein